MPISAEVSKTNSQHQAIIVGLSCQPQLEACIEAVKKQPFDRVDYIIDVCPEFKAANKAFSIMEAKWIWLIAGDMVLYPDAMEIWEKQAMPRLNKTTSLVTFLLYDPFLGRYIGGLSVKRRIFYQNIRYENILMNDRFFNKTLAQTHCVHFQRKPLREQKIAVATHCENPNEFQVFSRLYARGVKARLTGKKGFYKRVMEEKLRETLSPLYKIGLEAWNMGYKSGHYPTSHSVEFDRQMYNQWKQGSERNA